jgi:hypothetical protein
MVRKLPVIQTPSGEDAEAAERPAWHWLLLGALCTIVLFLPLATLSGAAALPLARALAQGPHDGLTLFVVGAGLPLAAFALASFASGAVLGRFGLRTTKWTAPLAAALAALVESLLTALSGRAFGIALAALLGLATVGPLAAWFGARYGRKKRP